MSEKEKMQFFKALSEAENEVAFFDIARMVLSFSLLSFCSGKIER